jgi:cysteine desulfurase
MGNPSSAHRLGRKARELMEKARDSVAKALSTKPSEVIFTSGVQRGQWPGPDGQLLF